MWTLFRSKRKHKEAVFIRNGDEWIAKVYGHDGQDTIGHAKVIAAAPELLAALRLCLSALEVHDNAAEFGFHDQQIESARRAIDKASSR